MLKNEASWFGECLAEFRNDRLFPMVNVGSADASRQRREQPWIEEHVLAPLRARGERPLNIDLFPGEGVDLAGDLTQPSFVEQLSQRGFRSVICSNVLEHVPDPRRLAAGLVAMLPPGGLLFVSVPYRFPYHPDPLDTMFRPTPQELAAMFPGTTTRTQSVVNGGTLLEYVGQRILRNPAAMVRSFTHKAFDRKRAKQAASAPTPASHGGLALLRSHLPWLVKQFEVSCVVLVKEGASSAAREAGHG